MPCKRAGKNTGIKDLYCRERTFLPLDGASCLLGLYVNISDASHLLFPLISSCAPPFYEALDCLQFAYTGNRFGSYVAQALINWSSPLSWKGGRSFLWSSGGYKIYTLGPTPGGLHLQLVPLGMNTGWNGYLLHRKGTHTYIYSPLVGIPCPFGCTSAEK